MIRAEYRLRGMPLSLTTNPFSRSSWPKFPAIDDSRDVYPQMRILLPIDIHTYHFRECLPSQRSGYSMDRTALRAIRCILCIATAVAYLIKIDTLGGCSLFTDDFDEYF